MQRTDCGPCRLSILTCDGRQEETLARAKNWLASPADCAIPFVDHLRTPRTSTNDEKAGGGCLWLRSILAVATYPIGWSLGESSARKRAWRRSMTISSKPTSGPVSWGSVPGHTPGLPGIGLCRISGKTRHDRAGHMRHILVAKRTSVPRVTSSRRSTRRRAVFGYCDPQKRPIAQMPRSPADNCYREACPFTRQGATRPSEKESVVGVGLIEPQEV
jgi:hypothetical protein